MIKITLLSSLIAMALCFGWTNVVEAQSYTQQIQLFEPGGSGDTHPAGIRGSDEGDGGEDPSSFSQFVRSLMAYNHCIFKTMLFLNEYEIENNVNVINWHYTIADAKPNWDDANQQWVFWAFYVEATLEPDN